MPVKLVDVEHHFLRSLLNHIRQIIALLSFVLLASSCQNLVIEPVPVVTSAEANIVVSLKIKDGMPLMKIDYKNRSIINPSSFGLIFLDSSTNYRFGEIIPDLQKGVKSIELDSVFKVFNVYNDMSVKLIAVDSNDIDYEVMFRVYEEGLGFKYNISDTTYINHWPQNSNEAAIDKEAVLMSAISLELAEDFIPLESQQISNPIQSTKEYLFKRENDRIVVGLEADFYGLLKGAGTNMPVALNWEKSATNGYESQWFILAVDEQNSPSKRAILRAKLRQ